MLPEALRFVWSELSDGCGAVVVACEGGDEASAAVAAAALVAFHDANLRRLRDPSSLPAAISKERVRAQFQRLQQYTFCAQPPRRLMKQLNIFFVGEAGGWGEVRSGIVGAAAASMGPGRAAAAAS